MSGDYTRWLETKYPNSNDLRGPENALPHDYTAAQAWRTALPEKLYPSSYITEKSLEYLENHVASNADNPFFMMMSYPDPHHPFTPPGKYWDMYKPEDMPIPDSFFSNTQPPPNVGPPGRDEGNHGSGQGYSRRQRTGSPRGDGTHLRMITMIDDSIGQVLGKLEDLAR